MTNNRKTLPAPPPIEGQPVFGRSLRAWRESVGWSQDKLARVLGISRLQVVRWENPEKHGGQAPVLKAGERYRAFCAGDLTGPLEDEVARLRVEIAELRGISFGGD